MKKKSITLTLAALLSISLIGGILTGCSTKPVSYTHLPWHVVSCAMRAEDRTGRIFLIPVRIIGCRLDHFFLALTLTISPEGTEM